MKAILALLLMFNGVMLAQVPAQSVKAATSTAALRVAGGMDIPFQHTIIDAAGMPSTACKALGDLDGDGFIDICTASSTDPAAGLVWYRYPNWEKYMVAQGIFTTAMTLADIDGDGDLDMVIPRGTYYAATVCWYENPLPLRDPGTGPWTMHIIGEEPGHDISAADIDKDGRMDVVVRDGSRTVIFFQSTGGVWIRNNISTRPSEGTSLGDLDGDGDLDVVINGYWLQNPLPLASPITGTWTERTIDATWPTFAKTATADLNGDGRLDVILTVSESPNSRFSWFESTSPVTGPWVEHVIDNTLSYLHSIAVADMDMDGYLDVITAEMHNSSDPDLVCIYRNGGGASPNWTRQILATTGSHNLVVGDIGRDGDIDILGSNCESTPTNSAPTEIWVNLALHLPVQLTDFRCMLINGRSVELSWRTLTEVNNYGFTVQRELSDEQGYVDVAGGFVPGKGTPIDPCEYTFTDTTLTTSGQCSYRLMQTDLDGTAHYSNPVGIRVTLTDVDEAAPERFALKQNYPNPFNPSTSIRYQLPVASVVRLVVCDLLGREVAVLVNESEEPGIHEALFNAQNFPSGVYFYTLQAGSFSETRKLSLVR